MFRLGGDEVKAAALTCDPAVQAWRAKVFGPWIVVRAQAVHDLGDQFPVAGGENGKAIHAVFLYRACGDIALQRLLEDRLSNGFK